MVKTVTKAIFSLLLDVWEDVEKWVWLRALMPATYIKQETHIRQQITYIWGLNAKFSNGKK